MDQRLGLNFYAFAALAMVVPAGALFFSGVSMFLYYLTIPPAIAAAGYLHYRQSESNVLLQHVIFLISIGLLIYLLTSIGITPSPLFVSIIPPFDAIAMLLAKMGVCLVYFLAIFFTTVAWLATVSPRVVSLLMGRSWLHS